MTGSALIGYPPGNQRAWYIIRGFYRAHGFPEKGTPDLGIPSLKAKPGVPHGQSNGPETIAANTIFIILLTLITSARLSLRYFRHDLRWGPDDYAIVVGLAGVVAWFGLAIVKVQFGGAGKHMYDVTYAELDWFVDISTAQTMLFYVAAGFVKISICLFNRRLTGLTSRSWMICHNVMLGLISCFILASVFGEVFKCSPPLTQWGFLGFGRAASPPTHCLKAKEYGLALSVLHIIFDFTLLSVPLIVLGKMRMSTSKRIRLVLLFSIGSVSCIGSVMRQVIAYQTSKDATWDSYHNAAWTDIDLFFGTLAASLPVLNSLIPKKWRSRSPSVEDPEKMAARLRNPDRNLDSDSTLHGGRELRFHSEDILDASANASTRGSNSFDDSNVDGTVRVQQPPHALPRDRLNQAPYSRSDFL